MSGFFVGLGVLCVRSDSRASPHAHALLRELLELGFAVRCCGNSLKHQSMSVTICLVGGERLLDILLALKDGDS